jgi:hypothetical protein
MIPIAVTMFGAMRRWPSFTAYFASRRKSNSADDHRAKQSAAAVVGEG